MARDTGIADRLRAKGLVVVEIDGWQTRGSDSFNPKGAVDHHTVGGPLGNAPSLKICINGRSDLPGPLCNVLVGRDNTCYVIAAGRANHAGTGGWAGLSGNSSVYGVERENVGYGDREPWRPDQTDTAARVLAALIEKVGSDPSRVCEHKEWTSRKIDCHSINGSDMRALVGIYLGHVATPAPVPAPVAEGPRTLRRGMSGPDVRDWQTCVKGVEPRVIPDGIFGPMTEYATKVFQQKMGLAADGIVGPITRKAMEDLLRFLAAAAAQPAAPPFPGRTMRSGMRGNDVRQVQQRLRDRGWNIGVDGVFGPGTDAIVRAFQRDKGLAADGVVGPKTWTALWTSPVT